MQYTVKQLAGLAGVSARTLRYYHEIGLLRPGRVSDAGYRFYGPARGGPASADLVLPGAWSAFGRDRFPAGRPPIRPPEGAAEPSGSLEAAAGAAGFPDPDSGKTIRNETGGIQMTDKEKFEGFKARIIRENEEKYGEELRAKYGDQEIDPGPPPACSPSPKRSMTTGMPWAQRFCLSWSRLYAPMRTSRVRRASIWQLSTAAGCPILGNSTPRRPQRLGADVCVRRALYRLLRP